MKFDPPIKILEDFILIKLIDINEENWSEVTRLCVSNDQQVFIDRPIGIIARGYVYRNCNAKVIGISNDNQVIGFIQFQPIVFTSWFFEETYGFIRELWVAEKYRNRRHGSELLELTEKYLCDQGIYSSILTTDTAEYIYLKHGYVKAIGCKAKNKDDVYVKRLK